MLLHLFHWSALHNFALGKHLDLYTSLGHPYLREYNIDSTYTNVLCMSPLQSQILFSSEFIEVDITYKASVELDYLFNVVAFDYTTLKCKFLLMRCAHMYVQTH